MIINLDDVKPQKVATFRRHTRFHFQVSGPNTLRLAVDEQTLAVAHPTGQAGGLSFVSANGVVALTWIGELWAIGSAPDTFVDFEFPKEV